MHKNTIIVLFMFALCALKIEDNYAATCSCAGIPLSDALNQSGLDAKTWSANFNYNFHDLSDLVQGGTKINDETNRQRESTFYIAQLSYGLTDRWTVSSLTSYIHHYRQVTTSNAGAEISKGFGDTMIAVIYSPIKITPFSQLEIATGLGHKFTTGEDSNTSNGIAFIEDMQPSNGANSTHIWVYAAMALSQAANNIVHASLSSTGNGSNKQQYSFENEFNLAIAYNRQTDSPWSYNLSLNLQKSDAHTRFGFDVPNTGGKWVNLTPKIQYSFNENMAAQIGIQLPIKRDLNGALQFTTRYSLSIGINYRWQ